MSEPSDTSGSVSFSVRGLMSSVANSILNIFNLKRIPAFAAALGYKQNRTTVRILIQFNKLKFEVFTAVTTKNAVFWDVAPC
jgi:hypothetical protein